MSEPNRTTAEQIVRRTVAVLNTPDRLKTYLKSQAAAKRKSSFAKAWTNPTQRIDYKSDKPASSLKVTAVLNPSGAEGAATIAKHTQTTKKTPDPDHSDWICATKSVDLTADSSSYMNNDYSNSNSHIYPGAIFTFENFYKGDYAEQPGQRNPLTVYTDNSDIDGSSGVEVKDPNIVTIRDAIATIYRRFKGPTATEAYSSQTFESNNSAELNMQISGGASGFGVSFSDAFKTGNTSHSVCLTIDARKSLFSIGVLPPDNGFFTDSSVEATPNLMVVSNVSYGVRVLGNLNISFSSSEELDEFQASYSGLGYDAHAVFDYLQKNSSSSSTVNAYVIGGPSNLTATTFDPKEFLTQLNKIMEGASYENARPIGYQFMNMAGDIVGSQSATDHFEIIQCAPATDDPKVQSVRVEFLSGSDGKDWNTNLNVYVYPENFVNNPTADDMVGAVYGYQSQGHSWAFGGGQFDDVFLVPGDGVTPAPRLTRNQFNKDGAHVRLHIYPDGHDTWDVQEMNLYFNFEDGSSQLIKVPSFVVSQDVRMYDYFASPGSFAP